MAYIPKEVVSKVKEMDLLTYLSLYDPGELVNLKGDVYSTKTHDSLKISNGRWMWWSKGIGGKSALDYLIKVKGLSFLEGVELIIEQTGMGEGGSDDSDNNLVRVKAEGKKTIDKPNVSNHETTVKEIKLPERNINNNKVIAYLKNRGIDESIIMECIRRDIIYESEKYNNAIFVGKNEKGNPRFGFYRATNGKRIMGDLAGSDKRYSFQTRYSKSSVLHIFEGAMDLLSYATISKMKKFDWQKTNMLSLSGVYVPQKGTDFKLPIALDSFLEKNTGINKIYLHLDNDKAGMLATQSIQKALGDKYLVGIIPPQSGKDYNSYLQMLLKNQSKIQEGDVNLMDEKKLTVLVIKPNEAPKVVEISDTLKAMQETVGGYIQEVMPFKDDVAIVCNEEGKIQKLPPNRAIYNKEGRVTDIIVGDFFICRAPVESDSFESLTGDDIKKYKEKFQYPERFSRNGDEIIASKIKPNKERSER
jgi:hypothetical protein